jgi:glutamate-1-semialdehyde 2,1-aminomutase
LFFSQGEGPYLIDVDQQTYIDYVGAWGAAILGHRPLSVMQTLQQAMEHGLSFGAPTCIETELATKICSLLPSIEQIRMMASGTEATMTAIRLARGYTQRELIIKFEGCYHGHSDSLLIEAGSGALTLGQPSSPGIPRALAQSTLVLEYNRPEQVAQAFAKWGSQIAAVIVEPIAANMGCILPEPGFLSALRQHCSEHGSVLIFDEVITGFRVNLHGAQGLYGVTPDLTTLGKIIGGGLPIGALGGSAKIMAHLAPQGPVYQAGTLSGNPLAMHAGLATINTLCQANFYPSLLRQTEKLVTGLQERAAHYQQPLCIQYAPGLFSLFFSDAPKLSSLAAVKNCQIEKFKQFYHALLKVGIYLGPSAFECGFLSSTHNESIIDATLKASESAFASLN